MTERFSGTLRVVTSGSSWKCGRSYAAHPDQVRVARAFLTQALAGCPAANDAVLICSELTANAIQHSDSSKPGGRFTVRAEVHVGDYLWIEVEDQGGPWIARDGGDERGRGLGVVASLAAEWGIEGDFFARVVWARLDWPAA